MAEIELVAQLEGATMVPEITVASAIEESEGAVAVSVGNSRASAARNVMVVSSVVWTVAVMVIEKGQG